MFIPDDDLYSIGAVGVLEPTDELDTTSDASDWVMQYTAWSEDGDEAAPVRRPAAPQS
jgi:hypothetical protein